MNASPSPNSRSRSLTLNTALITFPDQIINVGTTPYENREQLRLLRQAHSDTHLLHREGSEIWSVALVSGISPLGEHTVNVQLSKEIYLTAALVRHTFINFLNSIDRRILEYNPVEFVADSKRDNLLTKVFPSSIEVPDWLSLSPCYSAAIRPVFFDHQPRALGFVLDVRTKRWIEHPCNLLLEQGMLLTGLYVSQLIPHGDRRISPYPRLLGQIKAIENDQLILTDAREGFETVAASEVFLEPRQEAFKRCLEHLLKEETAAVEAKLDGLRAEFRSGPTRLRKLKAVINYLSRQSLELLPGVPFSFQPFASEAPGSPQKFPTVQIAPRAVYVFDDAGDKTNTWHDGGLNEYGPYSATTFTPSTPRICIICQSTRKGRVEQFLYKLLHGLVVPEFNAPKGKQKPQHFAKGLIRKYALENVETQFFTVENNTAAAYDRAVRQALSYQNRKGFRWNLALIQIDEDFHDRYGDDNPYLTTKAAFLAEQIPTQDFEMETIEVSDWTLSFTLNIMIMALAIYAKLGGIPWLIKANRTITYELVFGLGSAVVSQGRLGQKEQVVGITTVFSGDRNYILSNLSKAVPIAEYKEELLDSLRETITKVRGAMNWQSGNHIRLIFHAFKPLKDAEAEAVKALMQELGEYDVEYAFIHVIEDHPFVLFDEAEPGVWDPETRTNGKGKFAPKRGLFFRISKSEVLLCLTGAKEVKRPQDGIPTPILLRLHRESTFSDTTYLTRQVFTFSCHSWRSFFPSGKPVTITYSRLIAGLLGQLGTVSFWNPNSMLGRIGETRWFL